MANDLASLSSQLSQALRDTDHVVWNSIEKDALITWAVRSLWPRYARAFDTSLTGQTVTLVDNTYFYTLPSGMMEVNTVDFLDSSSSELGPLDGQAWQITGDGYSGSAKLRVSPFLTGSGGSVRLHGYGRYDVAPVGAGIALATSAAADDIIDTTTAHGLTSGNTVEFSALTGGTGLLTGKAYYVIAANLAATSFQVSLLEGGAALGFSTDITAGTVYATHYIPDDYVPLVLSRARAEAYRRMGADLVQSTNWQAHNQKQNISLNEQLGLIQEAQSAAALYERQTPRTWRRPVPGRLG